MAIDNNGEQLKRLVRKGKTKGYVLWDEIDEALPTGCEGGSELDDILSELADNGVRVRQDVAEQRSEDVGEEEESFDEDDLRGLTGQAADSDAIRLYLREMLPVPHLTREKEIELAKCISPGGQDAEDAERQLVEANLWLVAAIAKRYRNRGRGMLDLLQEGNIGLMKAVKKFNHTRGYRFSTYAIWWVRRAILRSIQ